MMEVRKGDKVGGYVKPNGKMERFELCRATPRVVS